MIGSKSFAAFLVVSLSLAAPSAISPALGQGNAGETTPIARMAGTWDVRQRMWTGPDSDPVALPAAVARRSMGQGGVLHEVMTPAVPRDDAAFTRTAFINYNPVSRRFEYFSIDSRAPQQMHYQSPLRELGETSPLRLEGGLFVAAEWGKLRNAAFSYRAELGPIENGRQVFNLYLTPIAGEGSREFRAFEYIYTRRK